MLEFVIFAVSPQLQPLNFTELGAVDDRDVGALIVRNSGSIVSFSVDVLADPCPDVEWKFSGTTLGPSNNTFMYNDPCLVFDAGDKNFIWTYTLNVVLTSETSGQYVANFSSVTGTALLLRTYFTIPSMLPLPCL